MLCVTVRLSRERFLAIPIVYQQTVQTTIFPVCQQMEHDSQRLAPRKANAMTAGSLDSDASLCRRVGRRHHHGERERVFRRWYSDEQNDVCGSRVAASRWLRSTLGAVIPWAKPATTRLEDEERAGGPARGAIAGTFAEAPAGANPEGEGQGTPLPPQQSGREGFSPPLVRSTVRDLESTHRSAGAIRSRASTI